MPPSPSSSATPARTIVVVGAGFSGVAVAVQLLRRCARGTEVVLVNESGRMARGLAYGTRSAEHVLNVPAGNMSALAEEPDSFLDFCRSEQPQVAPGDFMPRRLYGDYLEALLASADQPAADGPRLRRIVGRVQAVRPDANGATVAFDEGTVLRADDVVLAFGHFAPRSPLLPDDERAAGDAFIRDPWRADALAPIGAHDPVVLIGAGLTAMDVTLALQGRGHQGPVVSVSRHGLAPVPHRASHGHPAGHGDEPELVGAPLRTAVAALRRHARTAATQGRDWRDLMVALRARTPALWAGLSDADKARFMRHVRPYWEVLRHRCAPAAHAAHEQLAAEGRLERIAGRVERVGHAEGALEVTVRRRGSGARITRPAAAIVNCTGPGSDLRRSGSALIQQLLADGLLVPDPLALGLLTDAHYRVLGRDGAAVPGLHYLGPLLRATHWEATAVPELRAHAARLAERLSRTAA